MKAVQRILGSAKSASAARCFSSTPVASSPLTVGDVHVPGDARTRNVTVLPGHGIGPELVAAAMQVIEASKAPVKFEIVDNIKDKITPEAIASLKKNGVGLKGEFVTGIGRGSLPSINIELRKSLQLYANIVHSFNIPGIPARHEGVDIVIIRENTEGEYSGMEHEVAPGVTESLKVMTRDATRRIAQYAFEYAAMNNRTKVTAVHKANIMKKADGIFLESCQEVSKSFPHVQYEEVIVDNCMMQLVSKPQQFDVMVTPNFYGSLVSNTVAGIIGSPGIVPGASIGAHGAMFEQGARHVGLDIAGKGIVNPTSILLSSVMMLRYLRLPNHADRIEKAIFGAIDGGVKTCDVGGNSTTAQVVDAVISRLDADSAHSKASKKSKGVSKAV
jgi:isocitrate dehydrogenase (NAD+)